MFLSKSKIIKALVYVLNTKSYFETNQIKKNTEMLCKNSSLFVFANLNQFTNNVKKNTQILLRTCQLVETIKHATFLSNLSSFDDQLLTNCQPKNIKQLKQKNCLKNSCFCQSNANKKILLKSKSKF